MEPPYNCFRITLFMILGVSLFATTGCSNVFGPKRDTPPPNIILIFADDLGMETLGCYGSDSYQTPHLDKLASEGMKFSNCYSTPLCTPSRVQIMTGKYNFRNYAGFGILDPSETTFAHLLKDVGYQTCVVGKWQLYGNAGQQKLAGGKKGTMPAEAGFDDWCLWQVKELGSRYKSPKLTIKNKKTKNYPQLYGPDLFVNYLETFMEENRDSPFFIYYPMVLTHDPFQPTPADQEFSTFDPAIHGRNDTTWFSSMVEYMDHLVGRIVNKTKELALDQNTLILFVGDNGTHRSINSRWRGQGIRGSKSQTIEWGTHVPFIAHWPQHIKPNQINDNLIDFTDFVPTLMDVATSELPDNYVSDGISFYPQFTGEVASPRSWVFCHYDPRWGNNFKLVRYIHDKQWKLYDDGRIYNFRIDPSETKILAIDSLEPDAKQAVEHLSQVLASFP